MKIDLHIHSRDGSDGRWPVEEIFAEAARRGITLMSITDHDSIDAQPKAMGLARAHGMKYVTGVELNVTLSLGTPSKGKAVSLDLLGYGMDIENPALREKLGLLRAYRRQRALLILEKLNDAFRKEGRPPFDEEDMASIEEGVEGSLGRPHIARYLIEKGIVSTRQEAFDKYLVACDVPKMHVSPEEASALVRKAGGVVVLAHPNDPNGTSLASIAAHLRDQASMIEEFLLPHIDGIECWHTRHDAATSHFYLEFTRRHNLLATGGSDCHQSPPIMGSVHVPDCVAGHFGV